MSRYRHKFYRTKQYKHKLEKLYNDGGNNKYPCEIVFVAENEPTNTDAFWFDKGKNNYQVWKRPNCNYTIKLTHFKHRGYHAKNKKYANKAVRRNGKLYCGKQYKKVYNIYLYEY